MICPDCGHDPIIGEWPFPCKGRGHTITPRDAQIHASQKVVIYENSRTGDIHIPGRADRPIDPKRAAAGYARRELNTHSEVSWLERKKGLVHEPGNFDSGSGTADKVCDAG